MSQARNIGSLTGDFRQRRKVQNPFVERPPPPTPNPHFGLSLFGFVIGVCEVVFGAILTYNSCGVRYAVLCLLGILTCFTVLSRFILPYVHDLQSLRRVYYSITVLVLAIAIVTLYFLHEISRQVICKEFICHSQVDLTEYVSWVKSEYGEKAFDKACKAGESYAKGHDDFVAKLREDMILALKVYYLNDGSHAESEYDSELVMWEQSDVRGFAIALGVAHIAYAVLLLVHNLYLERAKNKFMMRLVQSLTQKSLAKGQAIGQHSSTAGGLITGAIATVTGNGAQGEVSAEERLGRIFSIGLGGHNTTLQSKLKKDDEDVIAGGGGGGVDGGGAQIGLHKTNANSNARLEDTQGIEPPNTEVRFIDQISIEEQRTLHERDNSRQGLRKHAHDVELQSPYGNQNGNGRRTSNKVGQQQQQQTPNVQRNGAQKNAAAASGGNKFSTQGKGVFSNIKNNIIDSKKKPMLISDFGDATQSIRRGGGGGAREAEYLQSEDYDNTVALRVVRGDMAQSIRYGANGQQVNHSPVRNGAGAIIRGLHDGDEAESIRQDTEDHNLSFGRDVNDSRMRHDEDEEAVVIP